MSLHIRSILASGLLLLLTTALYAQPPQPNQGRVRPTVSPYLQLGRGDASPGILYFNQVRPQQRMLEVLQQQNRQLQNLSLDQARSRRDLEEAVTTGHVTYFNNHSHYFVYPRR